jgi:hypothetical protein
MIHEPVLNFGQLVIRGGFMIVKKPIILDSSDLSIGGGKISWEINLREQISFLLALSLSFLE